MRANSKIVDMLADRIRDLKKDRLILAKEVAEFNMRDIFPDKDTFALARRIIEEDGR